MSFDRNKTSTGDSLGEMTNADFIARWREIVGEPPSIMLDDRREMIAILVAASEAPAEASETDEEICLITGQRARWAA